MKRALWVMVALMTICPAWSAEETAAPESPPDPMEILGKVDQAVQAVRAVRYTARSTPSGIAEKFFSAAEGEAVVVGWNQDWGIPEKFYVHVKTKPQGSDEPVELSGGGNGDSFFLIDHASRKAYEDMDPAVLGSSGNTLQAFGMQEFVRSAPFADELNAPTVEYRGVETVGGEECHKVFVDYGGGRGQSTWLFSTRDYLPRRRVQHFTLPQQGDGTLAIEITRLEVNPEIDAATFRLKLPEGYQRVDDFAP